MSFDVIVFGAGGFGRETLDVIEASNRSATGHSGKIRVIGVADDSPTPESFEHMIARGYRYLGTTSDILDRLEPHSYVIGIGDPGIKSLIDQRLTKRGWRAVTLIHPSASVGSVNEIGDGSIICGGVQLSTNTVLGKHVHLNPNATIGHDALIKDYVSVNPGAVVSGEVVVEPRALLGAGSVVLQGLSIGRNVTVGAGACVVSNVGAELTVVGIPARELQSSEPDNRKIEKC
ncbi:acetyltransferase [Yaniella halotolerans]|uniref:acetyltransferase n=1 Tax=Yaniella halotolerans TaxID=225453 RepID=UPI0003B783BA|nr:acetyltransferase [Yaniella halotolerans]